MKSLVLSLGLNRCLMGFPIPNAVSLKLDDEVLSPLRVKHASHHINRTKAALKHLNA